MALKYGKTRPFLSALLIGSLAFISPFALANKTTTATIEDNVAQSRVSTQAIRSATMGVVSSKTRAIRDALSAYRMDQSAWPASLAELNSSGYYTGDFATPYGVITGAIDAGGGYALSLDLPDGVSQDAIGKVLAAKVLGDYSSGVVNVNVSTPSAAVALANKLDRQYDPLNPDGTTMLSDLHMSNQNILELNRVDAVLIDASQGTFSGTLSVDGETNLTKTTISGPLSATGPASFEDSVTMANGATITNGLNVDDIQSDSSSTGTLVVENDTTLNGPVIVNAAMELNGSFVNNGDSTLQNVNIQQGLIVDGSTTLQDTTATTLQVSDSVSVGELLATTKLKVQDTAEFFANAIFHGNVLMEEDLTVNGLTSVSAVDAAQGFRVGGTEVISSELELFEKGQALKERYLGINDTAESASGLLDKDGNIISSTNFARLDTQNTYTDINTFNKQVVANGGLITDGKWVVSADGTALYENNVSLKDKYLGINAKAKSAEDSDKLGGAAAALYARRDQPNTFSAINTFSQLVNANNGIKVDNKWVISADGTTLYENNVSLKDKYLGINAKAKSAENSDKLGGAAAALYARRDTNNTFSGLNTYNQRITANGGLVTDGKWVISADGTTLYENNVALKNKYLGINDTAQNAVLFDSHSVSEFARLAVANTFSPKQTFNNGILVNGAKGTFNNGLNIAGAFTTSGTGTHSGVQHFNNDVFINDLLTTNGLKVIGNTNIGGTLVAGRVKSAQGNDLDNLASRVRSLENEMTSGGGGGGGVTTKSIAPAFTKTSLTTAYWVESKYFSGGQVSVGDYLEFNVNIYNGTGFSHKGMVTGSLPKVFSETVPVYGNCSSSCNSYGSIKYTLTLYANKYTLIKEKNSSYSANTSIEVSEIKVTK